MPLGWVQAGLGVAGLLTGGGGQQAGGSGNPYAAQSAGQQYDIANTVSGAAQPAYLQSLNAANAINYQPYLQASQQAGQQYGVAGQQASQAGAGLYGAGSQILNTAFDPQNALYARTQQQVGDQINAGQAQRGLGDSPVGAAEYGQGMSNFNIDWQNQQLQRQAQGITSAGAAANAGGAQSGQGAQWLQTAGQLPTSAQQYVAGQPAAAANQYAQNMGGVSNLYGNAATTGNNYQGIANQATQAGYNATTAQNTANANLLYQGGTGIYNAMVNPYQQQSAATNAASNAGTYYSNQPSVYGGP